MAEDDDRPGDASSAADASWADVVVPDDISSLVADVEAYRREVRRHRRRALQSRIMSKPGILPLSIVSIALLLAGLVATLLTVLAPSQRDPGLVKLPLATGHLAPAGSRGGLVPAVSLQGIGTEPISSTELRPSVIALVPAGCNCTKLLNNLAGAANGFGYRLNVVVPSSSDEATLRSTVTGGNAQVFLDPAFRSAPAVSLHGRMKATNLTLILVKQDGLIYTVDRNITSASTLLNVQLGIMRTDQGSGD
jgi:hypothetical protein